MVVANDIKVEAQQELRALRRQLQEEQDRNAKLSADLEALQGVRYHLQHFQQGSSYSSSPLVLFYHEDLRYFPGYQSKNNVFSIISFSQRLQNQLSEQEEMCLEWKLFSSHHISSRDLTASFGKLLVCCSISVCVFYPWKLLPSMSPAPALTIAHLMSYTKQSFTILLINLITLLMWLGWVKTDVATELSYTEMHFYVCYSRTLPVPFSVFLNMLHTSPISL